MFNTNLPSGRRRLFLLVLFVFVVAGFSAKYLLIHLGWVGNAGQQDKKASEPTGTNRKPGGGFTRFVTGSSSKRRNKRQMLSCGLMQTAIQMRWTGGFSQ